MAFLSHIYRSLSSAIKPSSRASLLSSSASATATASSSSLAQRLPGIMAVKEFVDKEIAENKIVVFSKSYCPYCAKTKDYFAKNYPGETIKVVELDIRSDESAVQDYLKEKTGARSVPRTFINGVSVGGNDALQKKTREEVDELLAMKHL